MKIAFKFIYARLVVFTVALCIVNVSIAQTNESYNEDDYDGEYDYSEEDVYNGNYGNIQQTKKAKYGNSRNEEELYNGQYQKYNKNTETSLENWLGKIRIFENDQRNTNNAEENRLFPVEKAKTPYRPGQTISEPEGTKPDEGLDGQIGIGGDSKEVDPEDGNNPGTPPPPPDEPDVPVDTAIPIIMISGLLLAIATINRKQTITNR